MKITLKIEDKPFCGCILRDGLTIDVPLLSKYDIDYFLDWIKDNQRIINYNLKPQFFKNGTYVRPFFDEGGKIFDIHFEQFSDDDSTAILKCGYYEMDQR